MRYRNRIFCTVALITACLNISVPQPSFAQNGSDDYDAARHILATRCSFCHTAIPQEDGLNATSQPPKGVTFDSAADIRKFAPQILLLAVKSRLMPPDNATHMSDKERVALGKWIEAGAKIP